MRHDGFRIPDKVFATLAVVVLLVTWVMLMWAWPILPDRIPTHFGAGGMPDAWGQKSFWNVFILASLPTLIGILFGWLYRHPMYSNIPSSVLLSVMPEPERTTIIRLIRHLLVMIYMIMTLLFAYVSLAVVSGGLAGTARLNPWLIFGLVGFLLLVAGTYTVWMAKIARAGVAKLQTGKM